MKLCSPTRILPTLAGLATGGILALGVATAAEPPSDTPDATVEVTGESLTQVAFEQLVGAFESEGWALRRVRKDGVAVFKHRNDWKGAVLVGQHGSTSLRRPVLHDIGAAISPLFVAVSFQALPDKRKMHGPRQRVLLAVNDELEAYRGAITAASAEERETALLRALDDLWERGTPLIEGEPISDYPGRRAAALTYWVTRTETPAGRASQAIVSRWLSAVVQTSAWPLMPDEIQAAEAERSDGARVLEQPASPGP